MEWKLPHIYWKITIEMAWQTYEMPLENFSYFQAKYENENESRRGRYENQNEIDNEIFMKCSYDILLQLMSEAQHLNEWET